MHGKHAASGPNGDWFELDPEEQDAVRDSWDLEDNEALDSYGDLDDLVDFDDIDSADSIEELDFG